MDNTPNSEPQWLREIEERRSKITPPPWGPHEMTPLCGGAHEWFEVGPYPNSPVCELTNDYDNFRCNADFIAKSPDDIDKLIAEYKAMREQRNAAYERAAEVAENQFADHIARRIRDLKEK